MIDNPNIYKTFIRPLLFLLEPEKAQSFADYFLRRSWIWNNLSHLFIVEDERLETDLCGIKLKNPVGLAAGYDKDCEMLSSLSSLGFGYVSGGTVVTSPQPGNPKPRILRYKKDSSLINSLGFPSRGLGYAHTQLEKQRQTYHVPIVVSISGTETKNILNCLSDIEHLSDAIELNISSPNTSGLKIFQKKTGLSDLLERVNDIRSKPLFVKLPPYSFDDDMSLNETRDQVLSLVHVCKKNGVDALTVANSQPNKDRRLAVGMGGVSGKIIFSHTVQMVSDVRREVGAEIAINASGGIFSGSDALQVLKAGASTVQILTALVYRGPGVAKAINSELLNEMETHGVTTNYGSPSSE